MKIVDVVISTGTASKSATWISLGRRDGFRSATVRVEGSPDRVSALFSTVIKKAGDSFSAS